MTRKGLFIIAIGITIVPTNAQTTEPDTDRGHHLAPALQKKLAERLAATPYRAAGEAMGPLVDRVSRDWTLEAANCSLIKSQVKFTGVKRNTLWLTPNTDGTFYFELHRDLSGTATDANGNKYVWLYNESLDLDMTEPGLTDTTKITGSATDTLQLIPLTTTGTGFTLTQYLKVDTPTLLNNIPPPTSTGPVGCNPF